MHRDGDIIINVIVNSNTVDPVIFACLDFCEFVISGLFTKSSIRKLSNSHDS